MTREEFIDHFGIMPEKCKELMERVEQIISSECKKVIVHADYYIDPFSYLWSEEELREKYGDDALEKSEEDDGYPNLYDYKRDHNATELFKMLISYNTRYGGHTSAIEACELMGLDGWGENR